MTPFDSPGKNLKNVGEGENAGYQHFLLFKLCLYSMKEKLKFLTINLSSAGTFNLDNAKMVSSNKGLIS